MTIHTIQASLFSFSFLIILYVLILWSRLGLEPDAVGWGLPGVPLLTLQVVAASGICLCILLISLILKPSPSRSNRVGNPSQFTTSLDFIICILVWFCAFQLWRSIPLNPGWFNPKPVAPNFEYYPFSDSLAYDLPAQNLLIGNGLGEVVIRPAYSTFLALAQGLSGIGYNNAITWQLLFLALIPVYLYLLTITLHSRLAGIFIAILAIMHQYNAISLTGITDVSNAKMIMADLPAQFGVILFCLIIALWIIHPETSQSMPLLIGGILGIYMLVRTQLFLIIPVLPLLAIMRYRENIKYWLRPTLIFLIGIIIAQSPWVIRNTVLYNNLGSDPEASGILERYSDLAPGDRKRQSGESDEALHARRNKITLQYIQQEPLAVARVIANHYINNHISSLFIIPTDYQAVKYLYIVSANVLKTKKLLRLTELQCCSISTYVNSSPYWKWGTNWRSNMPGQLKSALVINLLLIAIGFGSIYSKYKLASLAIPITALLYDTGNAIARLSGWRFNQPVEWWALLLYGIGLTQIIIWIWKLIFNNPPHQGVLFDPIEPVQRLSPGRVFPLRQMITSGVVIFLIGAAIPFTEGLIWDRYYSINPEEALSKLAMSGAFRSLELLPDELLELRSSNRASLHIGRCLYPRFYLPDQGAPDSSSPAYGQRDFSRLGFVLIPGNLQVILPIEPSPEYFPNGLDVLVFGCDRGTYIEAYLVATLYDQ